MRHKEGTRPRSGTDQDLAGLAHRQHGVVSVRQLRQLLGYSPSAITRATADGRLHRLYRGVYAVGHTRISRHGECLAAVLACGPGSLLSHRSAAWLWGISPWGRAAIAVTTVNWRSSRPRIEQHQSRCLAADDHRLAQMIPVTAVPRTLLDSAATVPFARLRRMLERSEELKLFDLGPVEDLLDRTKGHQGWGRLRRAIALYEPPPFTRSLFERRFFDAAVRAELPRPATNFVEAGFELDVYWPEYRFAVELDVYATHGGHGAFERDRLRQEDLKLAGIEMTRVTDVRFHREPREVLARVGRLLERRRRELRQGKAR
jgi:Transcriptional regulator, AbiEi antitoxin